ncbi:IMP cyclohydrolase [Lacticaseibacillus paracasei]|nr:IMP cyclohydrolase [Lacticaseibacillus paracasei]MCT3353177.1 IMP cyclohydrolase [Lacticaseibacillus paracasei]MCT4393898.1 IMP cyclohydrolase [Lacticaseibacillus paracasei]RUS39539.1 IMP cyclohydrolase [Lacticaseibacillus paracasei]
MNWGKALTITRSPAQQSVCKDLVRHGQSATIAPKVTYTPVANRAGSRSRLGGISNESSCFFRTR